jgi:hypothetical protein
MPTPESASNFQASPPFIFSEKLKTMKKTDTYTLFTIHFEKQMEGPKWFCRSVQTVTTGLTLHQASEVAGRIYAYQAFIPDEEGNNWQEHLISCVVRDGCTLPKPELVNPTTFNHWEKHHRHLVETGKVL